MKKNIIKYVAAAIFIVAVVASGFFFWKNQGVKIGSEQERKESEMKTSEIKGEMGSEVGTFDVIYPEPEEVFLISGTIKLIGENVVVMETDTAASFFAAQDQRETDRTQKETINILIDKNTKIMKASPYTLFSPGEDLSKKSQAEADKFLIKLSDLTVGSSISAMAGENIKGKKEFTASLVWNN